MAATYIKLQDAYVSESNKVGSWRLIGYVAPGAKSASEVGSTTNFAYTAGSELAVNATSGEAVAGFDAVTWTVKTRVALNDCPIDTENAWKLAVKGASNGNSVGFTATVDPNCEQLTPSFNLIGK